MKKIMAIVLSALMLTAFAACNEEEESVKRDSIEGAVELYFNAWCEADAQAVLDLYPDEMVDFMIDRYGSKSEMKKELREDLKEALGEMENEYGDFKRYEFEVIDSESMDRDERDEIEEYMRERTESDINISSVKTVEVEYTIYFEDDEYDGIVELMLMKVDGQWYLFEGADLFN